LCSVASTTKTTNGTNGHEKGANWHKKKGQEAPETNHGVPIGTKVRQKHKAIEPQKAEIIFQPFCVLSPAPQRPKKAPSGTKKVPTGTKREAKRQQKQETHH